MDSGASSANVVFRSTKQDKSRRSWNAREEEVLIHALKGVVTEGWKSENGFRAGYLSLLENAMQVAIPKNTLRGTPHINSKIHVWKKTYSTLVTLLSRSGVGWNDSNNTIDATDETWEAITQTDPTILTMRHKQWNHFHDWCEIFGNERAAGDQSFTFKFQIQKVLNLEDEAPGATFLGETPPLNPIQSATDFTEETHSPSPRNDDGATSKCKKRKKAMETDQTIYSAINNLATITKDTMADLIKQLAVEDKISDAQDQVLTALNGMTDLTEDDQVLVAKLLFNNLDDLALFQQLAPRGRICLVKRILEGQ